MMRKTVVHPIRQALVMAGAGLLAAALPGCSRWADRAISYDGPLRPEGQVAEINVQQGALLAVVDNRTLPKAHEIDVLPGTRTLGFQCTYPIGSTSSTGLTKAMTARLEAGHVYETELWSSDERWTVLLRDTATSRIVGATPD
jgi:hypothetical protein